MEFTLKEIRYIHDIFPESSAESRFGMSTSKSKVALLVLDDTKIMESLDKIEEKIDRIAEKANRLESTLEGCGKPAE